ncbi:unnamed protein product [Closterium sp. NIES-64]|nr:unnamed protein product [Closterium sp. NIES-64]
MASQRSLSSDDTKATMSSQPHPSSNQQNADPNGSNVSRGSNRSNGSNDSNGSPIVVLSYRQAARLVAMSTVVLVLLLAAAFHLGRMSIGEIAAVDSSHLNNLPAVSLSDVSTLFSPETPRRRVLRSRGRPRPAKPAKKTAPAENPPPAENPAPAEKPARAEKPAPAKRRAPARKPAPRKKKPQAEVRVEVKEEAKEEIKSGGDIKEVVEVPADQAAAADDDAAKAAEAAAAAAAAAANGAGGEGGGGAIGGEAGGSAAAADSAGEPATPAATVEATTAAGASDAASSTSPAATSAPAEYTSASADGAAIPATTVDPTTYYTAEGLQRLQDPCGGIGGVSGNPGTSGNRRCYNRCHRRTRSGYCVKELLSLYDEAYSPLWPARVDLVVRSYVSDNFFLTAFLFASIEQMWPAGIGDVILVLDESDRHVEDIVPPWVKIYYEKNYLGLTPKLVQQWSYLWADNYTTAPYIAIIDDDVIFNLKVTPGLLFNLTDGKPFIIGSKSTQGKNWRTSSRYFVGPGHYFANFMVQLPFVFPRAVLPKFRDHVGQLHGRKFGGSFDAAFKFWSIRGPIADRSHVAHTTLGNYMWFFANDSAHWAFEWESRTPIPRVGVHIPHTHEFRNASGPAAGPPQRLVKTYVDLTGTYAHEGLCNAFPEGELAHCEDASREQGQIWRYALSGSEWSIFQSGTVNGTVMHDDYKWELKCMYERVVGAKTGEWKGDVEGKRQELELLSLYDEAYRPLWPARVDLVVRSYVSDNFFLTAFLFASIEQMWPAGIGDVILVLDEADRHVEDIVPPWVKIYYEKNVLDLPGKILQQWSYLWADNYTTAPYIAIIDDDVIFNLKVTPGLLFNLTNGKPYVIGSKNTQSDNWKPSSYYFVGRYHANYMVQLPFVFPRSVLPEFRRRAAKRHKKDFNAAVKYFADHGPSFAKTQIAHTTLGNYMWFFANDSVHWVLEWTPVTPLPRVGVHIPYTMKFRNITGHSGPEHRLAKAYVDVVGFYAHEGMCHAFPEGKLRNCEDVAGPQDQIWRLEKATHTLNTQPNSLLH